MRRSSFATALEFLAFDGTNNGTAYTFNQSFSIDGLGWGEFGYSYGALRVSGMNATFAGNITLAGDAGLYTQQLPYGAGTALDVTGVISGSANLSIYDGTGVLQLSNANAFTGATTVTFGSLTLSHSLALQNSTLTSGGVVFDSMVATHAFTFGGLSGSGNITLSDNALVPNPVALSIGNNNSSNTYSGILSAAGSLRIVGSGVATLAAANTYSGGTTVASGTLRVVNVGGSATGSGPVVVGDGAHPATLAGSLAANQGAITGPVTVE